jgi:hypothetical protein
MGGHELPFESGPSVMASAPHFTAQSSRPWSGLEDRYLGANGVTVFAAGAAGGGGDEVADVVQGQA